MKHPAGYFYVIRNSYDRFGCQKVVQKFESHFFTPESIK